MSQCVGLCRKSTLFTSTNMIICQTWAWYMYIIMLLYLDLNGYLVPPNCSKRQNGLGYWQWPHICKNFSVSLCALRPEYCFIIRYDRQTLYCQLVETLFVNKWNHWSSIRIALHCWITLYSLSIADQQRTLFVHCLSSLRAAGNDTLYQHS